MFSSCSVQDQFMFSSCSVHVEFKISSCSVHVQFMFSSCSVHVQFMYSSCSVHVQFIFSSYSVLIQSIICPVRITPTENPIEKNYFLIFYNLMLMKKALLRNLDTAYLHFLDQDLDSLKSTK